MAKFEIPTDASCYRTLGPWTHDEIPDGLQKQLRLKAGSWGKLTVIGGIIDFCWDDEPGASPVRLQKGQSLVIPPTVPHHLQLVGPVTIALSFYKRALDS